MSQVLLEESIGFQDVELGCSTAPDNRALLGMVKPDQFAVPDGGIQSALDQFETVGLTELSSVALLNRVDTKFVFHICHFEEMLRELSAQYYILEVDEVRMFRYHSVYLDTDNFDLYKWHHDGRSNRLKIRYRWYLDSGTCYFEVKYKSKGRTDKKRMSVKDVGEAITDDQIALIKHNTLATSLLQKKMAIGYVRITLVSKDFSERMTCDLNLSFDNFHKSIKFPELVIAELKTGKSAMGSAALDCFRKRLFRRFSFSKYATSVALLQDVKSNAFKPRIARIKRIIKNA